VSSFSINSSTGQLQTRAGVTYDYETKNSYSVIVNVSDGKDAAGEADTAIDDSIDVTINLMNVADAACAEPPVGLASAVNDDASGIVLTWEAPSGCSPDTYAVYRRTISEDGSRMARLATVDDAGLTYTDGNVSAGETYRYRVRSNDQGPRSAWTQTVMTEPEPKPGERADRSVLRNTHDATLSGLAVTADAADAITLTPTFASGTTEYRAWVANDVTPVTLTATKNDSNATVAITGDDDAATPGEAEFDLDEGANTLEVVVTAEDGVATET
jgi:hypothetical protein